MRRLLLLVFLDRRERNRSSWRARHNGNSRALDVVNPRRTKGGVLPLSPAVFFLDEIEVPVIQRKVAQLWVGALAQTVKVEFAPGHAADYLGAGSLSNLFRLGAGAFSDGLSSCCACCVGRGCVCSRPIPQTSRHGNCPVADRWLVMPRWILRWTVRTRGGNVPYGELLNGIILVKRAVWLPEVDGVVRGCVGGEEAIGSVQGQTEEVQLPF